MSNFSSAATSEFPSVTVLSATCFKPSPDPPASTVIETSRFSFENCSAATSTNGFNALEPAAVIVPLKLSFFESLSSDAVFELHPTIAADNPTIIAPFKNLFIFSLSSFLSTHIS